MQEGYREGNHEQDLLYSLRTHNKFYALDGFKIEYIPEGNYFEFNTPGIGSGCTHCINGNLVCLLADFLKEKKGGLKCLFQK